ncbi:MAG: hypothetical protein ACLTSX_02710 [Collinsella sp.]
MALRGQLRGHPFNISYIKGPFPSASRDEVIRVKSPSVRVRVNSEHPHGGSPRERFWGSS